MRPPRLLVIGCGDVGRRVLRLLAGRWRVAALVRDANAAAALRAQGVTPLRGDLDVPTTLGRLAGWGDAVLHLAPPPGAGALDTRTRHLINALGGRAAPRTLVYVSTTGVYGDCDGAWVDETRRLKPGTDRARRRVDAEAQLRAYARRAGVRLVILRAPGIYALDRPGGHPRERIERGLPVLAAADDVYTNHIHAEDLARACVRALHRGGTLRALNACDDSDMKMGDYFDLAADLCGLPRPERIARAEIGARLSPQAMSFLGESRRLLNVRLKAELGLRLRYPTVREGLAG
ncbi:MAG: SDR family oxidoreductase [Paucibacter sp.]|nr:SDR family oxidoreductase [Roseateles sp.]